MCIYLVPTYLYYLWSSGMIFTYFPGLKPASSWSLLATNTVKEQSQHCCNVRCKYSPRSFSHSSDWHVPTVGFGPKHTNVILWTLVQPQIHPVYEVPNESLCAKSRGFSITCPFQRRQSYDFQMSSLGNRLNPMWSYHGLLSCLPLRHCIADRFLFTLSLFKFTKLCKYFTDEQERVQKKTFTKWINTYLRKVSKTHYPIISATDYADPLVSVCLTGTCCCVKPHWLPDCVKPKNLSTMGDNEVTRTDNFEGYFEKKGVVVSLVYLRLQFNVWIRDAHPSVCPVMKKGNKLHANWCSIS